MRSLDHRRDVANVATLTLALGLLLAPHVTFGQGPARTTTGSDNYATAYRIGFSRPPSDRSLYPFTTPRSLATSVTRSPVRNRASFGRILAQVYGGVLGAAVVGFIAYKAFDNPADRKIKGDDSYSANANTAYALGSFVGSTAAVQLIGMGDGSRAPLASTAIGTGIVTVPLLFLREEPLLPIIGTLLAAPLQGLFGTAGYQIARRGGQ